MCKCVCGCVCVCGCGCVGVCGCVWVWVCVGRCVCGGVGVCVGGACGRVCLAPNISAFNSSDLMRQAMIGKARHFETVHCSRNESFQLSCDK